VRNAEDGCVRVLVDRDDDLGVGDAGEMLRRTTRGAFDPTLDLV